MQLYYLRTNFGHLPTHRSINTPLGIWEIHSLKKKQMSPPTLSFVWMDLTPHQLNIYRNMKR